MRRRSQFLQLLGITLVVLVIGVLGIVLAEGQLHWISRLYDQLVLDNKNHYLPCDQLPMIGEAEQILTEHQEALEQIEAVNPGFIEIRLDGESCPGRADLVIEYPAHRDRVAIEQIIHSERLFDLPYRLRNY